MKKKFYCELAVPFNNLDVVLYDWLCKNTLCLVDPLPVQAAVPLSVGTNSAQLYIQRPQLGLIDGVKVCVCPGVCDIVCEGPCGYTCDSYSLPAGVHLITLDNLGPGSEYQLRVYSTSREKVGPAFNTRPFRTGEEWFHKLDFVAHIHFKDYTTERVHELLPSLSFDKSIQLSLSFFLQHIHIWPEAQSPDH